MRPKTLFKALYWTVRLIRCDECKRVMPSFVFSVVGWNDAYLCRKCYNKLYKGDSMYEDFIQNFRPLRQFVRFFRSMIEQVGEQ